MQKIQKYLAVSHPTAAGLVSRLAGKGPVCIEAFAPLGADIPGNCKKRRGRSKRPASSASFLLFIFHT